MAASGQNTVNYAFDAANRMTQLAQGTSIVSLAYDPSGRRASVMLPNGVSMNYTYDSASDLTAIAYQAGLTPLGNLAYSYDPAGNRNGVGGSFARTSLPSAVSAAAYNANNQLTQWGSGAITYDANGNTVNDGTNTYSWNARNQLSAIGATSFQYDGFGRRARDGRGTSFLYDGVNVVQELSGGTPTANLLTGSVDEVFSRTDATGSWSFLADALGSTFALSDSTGGLQAQYTYEPFGNTAATGAPSTNAFQYTGRENDGSSLYYYRARYYEPGISRFLSEDPVGLAGGSVDLYSYVTNSPVMQGDPSGLLPQRFGPPSRLPPSQTPFRPNCPTSPGPTLRPGQEPPPTIEPNPIDNPESYKDLMLFKIILEAMKQASGSGAGIFTPMVLPPSWNPYLHPGPNPRDKA